MRGDVQWIAVWMIEVSCWTALSIEVLDGRGASQSDMCRVIVSCSFVQSVTFQLMQGVVEVCGGISVIQWRMGKWLELWLKLGS